MRRLRTDDRSVIHPARRSARRGRAQGQCTDRGCNCRAFPAADLRDATIVRTALPLYHPSLRIHMGKRVAYCDVCHWHGDVFTVIRLARSCSFSRAVECLATLRWTLRPAVITPHDPALVARSPISRSGVRGRWAVYPYYDEHWTLLYEKIRAPSKSFWYRRPDGETRLGNVRRVLYGLVVVRDVIAMGWPAPWCLIRGR